MTEEERLLFVAEAMYARHTTVRNFPFDRFQQYYLVEQAQAAIVAADATRPKLEVTQAMQAAFQKGYEACNCREDHRPLCCINCGLEAALKVMEL